MTRQRAKRVAICTGCAIFMSLSAIRYMIGDAAGNYQVGVFAFLAAIGSAITVAIAVYLALSPEPGHAVAPLAESEPKEGAR